LSYNGTPGELAFLSIVNDAFVWATVEMGKFLSGTSSAMTGDLGAGVYLFELYGVAPPSVSPNDAQYKALAAIAKANAQTGRGQRKFEATNADYDAAVEWFKDAYGADFVNNFTAPETVFNSAVDVTAMYISETARNGGHPPVNASFIRNLNPFLYDPNDNDWDLPPQDPNLMEIVQGQEAALADAAAPAPPDDA
jgi:hypothetical protein